jgi:hypothetical protein
MDVRCVRVRAGVGPRLEGHLPRVDDSITDRVVRGWVIEHRVKELDTIYAMHVHVDGVDYAVTVWVVVADTGLVRCVTQPPIAGADAAWPALVHAVTEPPKRQRQARAGGSARAPRVGSGRHARSLLSARL